MVQLTHITSPENALSMIAMKSYCSYRNPGSYDAGMNFLGVLGEYPNTQPTRGARMTCEWLGSVSQPLRYDVHNHHTPDVLFDFNGSGKHFRNNDPRYFLPYGSKGLIVKKIELEDNYDRESLVQWWVTFEGNIYPYLYKTGLFQNYLLRRALNHLHETNEKLRSRLVKISVLRGM